MKSCLCRAEAETSKKHSHARYPHPHFQAPYLHTRIWTCIANTCVRAQLVGNQETDPWELIYKYLDCFLPVLHTICVHETNLLK